jgi:hypothetical protein
LWTSVDQTGGDTFLYLAFSREAANGTVHLAIELTTTTGGCGTTARRGSLADAPATCC